MTNDHAGGRMNMRRSNILNSACAVNQLAGWRMPETHIGPEAGGGKSEQACLPGDGGYATPAACPVSTTSGAMVSGAPAIL
jgi:hypothetical protein